MLLYFKIPEFRLFDLVKFTQMYDIDILVCLPHEELLSMDSLYGYLKLNKSLTIPKEVQLEKLKENFGKFIKEAQ